MLLVGDGAQLQAVDAGGAFALLAASRDDTPELVEVHRFTHDWEKARLPRPAPRPPRRGRRLRGPRAGARRHRRRDAGRRLPGLARRYARPARQRAGHRDDRGGERLNERARAERILTGQTLPGAGGRAASTAPGPRSATSSSPAATTAGSDHQRGGWVRNGDRWQRHRRPRRRIPRRPAATDHGELGGGTVALPAGYVAEHVDLGYAITAHRAQGLTVDTAHVVVTGATTRENLYVAMTRGRDANTAYVALDQIDVTDDLQPTRPATNRRDVSTEDARAALLKILATSGAELSATQTLRAEQDTWATIAQLAGEYETIATTAQRDRWTALLHACLPGELAEQTLASDAFGPLASELRRADATGHRPEALLPRLVARHRLDDAHAIAAVLRHCPTLATSRPTRARATQPRLIAGRHPPGARPNCPGPARRARRTRHPHRTTRSRSRRTRRRQKRALGQTARSHAHQPGRTRSVDVCTGDHRRLPRPARDHHIEPARRSTHRRRPAPRPRPSSRRPQSRTASRCQRRRDVPAARDSRTGPMTVAPQPVV